MNGKELLVKRFKSLIGKTPIPKFNSTVRLEAYTFVFKLTEEITYEFVQQVLSGFQLHLNEDEYKEYIKLDETEKLLFLLDNVYEARSQCKRFYK